jgi:hypothetical protein
MAGNKSVRTRDLVVAENQDSPVTQWREIEHDTGVEWALLSGSSHGRHFMGYLGGKSFYNELNGGNYNIHHSANWGVNVTDAGGPAQASGDRDKWLLVDLHADVQILSIKRANDVYVWNSGTSQWDSDSTIASPNFIHGFFVINNELFALCETVNNNEMAFYSGGSLTAAGSYDLVHSLAGVPGGILVP